MNTFLTKMSLECFKAADLARSSRNCPWGRELLIDDKGRFCPIGHVLNASGVKISDPTMGPAVLIEEQTGVRPPDTVLSSLYQVMNVNDGLKGAARRSAVAATLRKFGQRLRVWGDLL